MKRTRLWSALVICLVVGLVVTVARRHGRAADPPEEPKLQAVPVEAAPVRLGVMETTVLAQGTLAPAQGGSARVASPTPGRLLEVRAVEGQQVSAGQVLAVIDNRPQEYGAALALAAERSDRDHGVKQAEIAVETARAELRKLQAGARPQEIAQAEQAVVQAKVTRDRASAEVERTRYLLDHGIASKRQQEDDDTSLAVADSALESARQQLSLLQAGARPEEVRAAKLAVSNAEQALALARESGDAHVRQAELALSQVKGGAPSAGPVAGASTVLRAPLSGVVTRRLLNPGDMADPAFPVIEIADSRRLDLVASLPAEDGMAVRAGMPARVSVAGRAGEGRVLSVGQVDPQTGLLSVRISVDNPDGRLLIGAFAQASIIVGADPQAVLVPKSAVLTREGKTVVLVAASGHAVQRTIEVGEEQGDWAAVRCGLLPGEQVIRSGQYELPDGAPIALVRGVAHP